MTTNHQPEPIPAFCNYEGSTYRTDFWEGQGRDYEDLAERIALTHMLPASGERIIDLGAGFGRLTDLYTGYRQVVLLDYSRSMLQDAVARLGKDPRFVFVAGNLYNLPFVEASFDTTVMVRVLHHLSEPPRAISEIQRIMAGGTPFVMEYANKRNIKAILRYALKRQADSPFSREPYEFVPLNYDFHPSYIEQIFRDVRLHIEQQRAVSAFRAPVLKRLVPAKLLARLDGWLQRPTAPLKLTPSMFLKATAEKPASALAQQIFRCPSCHAANWHKTADQMICQSCAARWSFQDGIYDFRDPIDA